MFARLLNLPLFVILMGIGALAMYLPAAHAAVVGEYEIMRAFFQSANLMLVLTALIGIATSGRVIKNQGRSYLFALLAAFTVLPLFLAVPFRISVTDTSFLNAYLEMVSDFSTTGLTMFSDPTRLPDSVHLWRAIVGWLGGFLMLVAAVAILAPMNLGGFEVLSSARTGYGASVLAQTTWTSDGSLRLQRFALRLLPIYAGLTWVLWITLLVLGDRPFVALCHAMSVISTSGISPVGGLQGSGSGLGGEAAIFLVLIFAISRQAYVADQSGIGFFRLFSDPEFRLASVFIILVPSLLFVRHWFGAYELDEIGAVRQGANALWGAVFTVMSFLTTTGFESAAWSTAQNWSGLATPGMILMGLALIGGGVATTAGGVKLLRVYALYKHGTREMDRLVHPSSVGGSGSAARILRRQGAYAAWIFFMLFALSLAVTVIAFTLTGIDFDVAMTLAIASLSTTGPLVNVAMDTPIDLVTLSDTAKYILGIAMVLGRLETLAIIALLNPEFWRT